MPSWKVTRSASLVNKTSIFGIMGGLYIIDQYTKGSPHYYKARSKLGLGSVTKYKRYKIIRK